jgi:hypothetical protein
MRVGGVGGPPRVMTVDEPPVCLSNGDMIWFCYVLSDVRSTNPLLWALSTLIGKAAALAAHRSRTR